MSGGSKKHPAAPHPRCLARDRNAAGPDNCQVRSGGALHAESETESAPRQTQVMIEAFGKTPADDQFERLAGNARQIDRQVAEGS